MKIEQKIAELEELLQSYTSEIRFSCLENTPFIIEVGAYTVGTDDIGVTKLQNVRFPMQFSKEVVAKIKEMKFVDGKNNPISPKIYTKHEWYSKQIENLKFILNGFQNQ